MYVSVLGIHLDKNDCSVVRLYVTGRVTGMEACCGVPYTDRVLARRGHSVGLMSPEFVRL